MKILIAGASGYVGRALIAELLKDPTVVEITALSRETQTSEDPRVKWVACDLFSLKSLERAVEDGVDVAYYLVHSMGPTAQMDQGSFVDYDLILADNFARAVAKRRVGRVIYLGGLIPERRTLSRHLASRLEVEQAFRDAGLAPTVFRAGLIVGARGSSFRILTKLVRRLPVMICPRWTQTLTTPVDLDHVTRALVTAASRDDVRGKTFDLAGCAPLTYVGMMRATAARLGYRRFFLTVPVFTPTLSRLWVRLITGSPKELVYPLVESLEHAMVARAEHRWEDSSRPIDPHRTYAQMLNEMTLEPPAEARPPARRRYRVRRKTVRSVQRLPLPGGRDAAWIRDEYVAWLPKFLKPLVRVTTDGRTINFAALSRRLVMLELSFSPERSSPGRQLLYVTGGRLAARDNKGRLEFRTVLGGTAALAAIHDFKPALPWGIYRLTQAIAHAWVMRNFARHLRR